MLSCRFSLRDQLGTIIAFNLNIVKTTLRSHSDNRLISRVNRLRWRLPKEWCALISCLVTIVVWKNLNSLLSIMWYDYLCICFRSFNSLFKVTNQILLFLSQMNIERLLHYYVLIGIVWGWTNSVLAMVWDSSILAYHLIILIEHEAKLPGLTIGNCWQLPPSFLLLLSQQV